MRSILKTLAWAIFTGLLITVVLCFIAGVHKGKISEISSTDHSDAYATITDSVTAKDSLKRNNVIKKITTANDIDTKNTQPEEVVAFAKTLIGVPYRYASTDPNIGFDCSGFITYVFNHFKIVVPRSSIDFTNVGKNISSDLAKPGDLILFTGTDSTEKFVGHMGLIVSNKNDSLNFIHSSSGKANGVVITALNSYYKSRYIKTVRIF